MLDTTTRDVYSIINNPADLVPEDRQQRVIQAGYARSNACWVIGKETLAQMDENRGRVMNGELIEVGEGALYAYFASLGGCATRTVREYVQLCRFYPQYLQDEFEILSVDHFRFAMRFGDREKARQILLAAKLQVDRNGGRPPTVDWLEAHFTGVDQVTDELSVFAGEELAIRGIEKSTRDPSDRQLRQVVRHLTKLVISVKKMIAPLVDKMPDVAQALDSLEQALQEQEAQNTD